MKKILVIEDDLDIQTMVEYILLDAGYNITSLNSKPYIYSIINIKPDLILLDHFLNDGFGGDFCLELKRNYLTQEIPVLMFSAINNLDQIAEANCADGYIIKPFDLKDLLATIHTYLK